MLELGNTTEKVATDVNLVVDQMGGHLRLCIISLPVRQRLSPRRMRLSLTSGMHTVCTASLYSSSQLLRVFGRSFSSDMAARESA